MPPPEFIPFFGALLGVLLGGLINSVAIRNAKSHEWRLSIAREQAASRQRLYAEILVEVQKLVIQAREDNISSLADLNALNCKFAEVSLVSSNVVIEHAKTLTDYAITCHSNQSAKEVADLFKMKSAFIVAARHEIEEILREVK